MPELYRYASALLKRYGWAEHAKGSPEVMQPGDLVNGAVTALLSGERVWVPGTGKTTKSLIAVICMTMRSLASHARTNAAIAKREGGLAGVRRIERAADRSAGPLAQVLAKELLGEVRAAIGHDREMVAYYEALAAGITDRKELRKKLKLASDDDVSALQKRTRRWLASRGISLDGLGEPQAPDGAGDDGAGDDGRDDQDEGDTMGAES